MKKGFILVAAIALVAGLLASCGSNNGTNNGTALFSTSNFQNAKVVIGFNDFSNNVSGAPTANTMGNGPWGNPVIANGVLYVPDSGNNRVLGFNKVPATNGASADFVLGQPDFVTSTSGDGANQMNFPQTIRFSNGKLFLCDYSNNRVLIWNTPPTTTGVPADVVVGQSGFGSSDSSSTQTGMNGPQDIAVISGKLVVTDSGNNRVMIWNTIPTTNGAPADLVLGQSDFTHTAFNDDDQDGTSDANPTARTLRFPYGVWSDGNRLIVTDPDNSRILIWKTFPTTSFQPADLVLGQSDFTHSTANDDTQGGTSDANPTARTLYSPYCVDSNGTQLFVTDSSNNRILIWDTIPTTNFAPADRVLGQKDFTHYMYNDDDQNGVADLLPSARTISDPGGIYVNGAELFVADTENNRFLIY